MRLSKKNEGGNVLIAITMQHKTQSQLLNSLYTTPILVRGRAILVNISGGKMGPRGTESIRERRMFNRYFIIAPIFVANPNEVFTLNVRLAFYVVNSSKFLMPGPCHG